MSKLKLLKTLAVIQTVLSIVYVLVRLDLPFIFAVVVVIAPSFVWYMVGRFAGEFE